jgi:hypothetical protein
MLHILLLFSAGIKQMLQLVTLRIAKDHGSRLLSCILLNIHNIKKETLNHHITFISASVQNIFYLATFSGRKDQDKFTLKRN